MYSDGSLRDAPLLQLHEATVVKNGARVLDSISLIIRDGEHSAVLGPNGAGKSSFIRLIARLDYPLDNGNGTPPVSIMGKELWNVFELRSRLGIVSTELQNAILNETRPRKTRGLEAALSGFFASYGIFKHHEITEAMRARARRALEQVEAGHLADRFIETMSAGEIRRIMIARALVSDPPALLLDEPSAGLDLAAQHRFLGAIRNLATQGTTIILVTHHIEEIFPEIDRVILLRRGRVLLDGAKRDALSSERLSDLYEARVAVQEMKGYYRASVG